MFLFHKIFFAITKCISCCIDPFFLLLHTRLILFLLYYKTSHKINNSLSHINHQYVIIKSPEFSCQNKKRLLLVCCHNQKVLCVKKRIQFSSGCQTGPHTYTDTHMLACVCDIRLRPKSSCTLTASNKPICVSDTQIFCSVCF